MVTGKVKREQKRSSTLQRKETIYLWKLNADGGGLGRARDEVRKGRTNISDHLNVVLLIFESLVPSIQL